jgi:hypothetical protein
MVDVAILATGEPARVEANLTRALYTVLNPLIGGSLHGLEAGWPVYAQDLDDLDARDAAPSRIVRPVASDPHICCLLRYTDSQSCTTGDRALHRSPQTRLSRLQAAGPHPHPEQGAGRTSAARVLLCTRRTWSDGLANALPSGAGVLSCDQLTPEVVMVAMLAISSGVGVLGIDLLSCVEKAKGRPPAPNPDHGSGSS